jgi:hypothetical protein
MHIKPTQISVTLPTTLFCKNEEEVAKFAADINSIIFGKVKIKYTGMGMISDKYVGILYLQRNQEYQKLYDEFRQLIEDQEIEKLAK